MKVGGSVRPAPGRAFAFAGVESLHSTVMHSRTRFAKLPLANYFALSLLLLWALVYQVRAAEFYFPSWFHNFEPVSMPFQTETYSLTASSDVIAGNISESVREAGVQPGDILLAVNGRPLKGLGVYSEELAKALPGETLQVTVRSPQAVAAPKILSITLRKRVAKHDFWTIYFRTILPDFCLFLGFWVAAVRPRDPLAWLVLALMFSFAGVLSDPRNFVSGPWLRDFFWTFRALAGSWPLWMLLFAIHFPEPYPVGSLWAKWRWLQWLFVVPVALLTSAALIHAIGIQENLASVAFFQRLPHTVDRVREVLDYVCFALAFLFIVPKWTVAPSADAKRRLQVLGAGIAISLLPAIILEFMARSTSTSVDAFPQWLRLTSYGLLLFFPATLAYVIVVQRALDVRIVVRQGVQYALAKYGVWLFRVVVIYSLGRAILFGASRAGHEHHTVLRYLIIGGGVVLTAASGRLAKRSRTWIDRHFFRDAYQAEQVLSDLSEKVRSIVETRPLLETVADRISESLHVPCIAVLLDGSGPYRPAYAMGYGGVPDVVFSDDSATVKTLEEQKEPARVYFDDPDSWIYQTPGPTEDERAKLALLRTELLLPISVKDRMPGFISLGQKRSEEPYSGADLRLLKAVADQTGLALEVSRLTAAIGKEIAQRERMNRELEIARDVQQRLFPKEFPVPGIEYCGTCRPAQEVGGDYYDFLRIPGGKMGIAIGDVSGKGISAALMMASLHASLRGQTLVEPEDLTGLMSRVNLLMYQASSEERYATFFLAEYDPAASSLSYVNAGHNPPMLLRKSEGEGKLLRLDVGGTVIGLLEDSPYEKATIAFRPGDLLVAFTDGITETMNHADEEWGEERLLEAIRRSSGMRPNEIIAGIMSAADSFAAGAKQHDDMTLVVLRVGSS